MFEHYPVIKEILAYAIALGLFIGIPQEWRENNSWWFAIPKFYLGILPFLIGALSIFSLMIGPIYGVIGLFDERYLWVTYGWVYLIGLVTFVILMNKYYPDVLDTL